MIALAIYLLKVSACSGLLYGYYYLALRNRVFHQYNRFYLLAAVLLSILLPFVPMPAFYEVKSTASPIPLYTILSTNGGETALPGKSLFSLSWEQAALVVYSLISLAMLVWMFAGLFQIRRLFKQAPATKLGTIAFVPTVHASAPFSFFNWLFWKKDLDLESPEGQSIFRHEMVHIHERHSIDKVFLQGVLVLLWVNPVFWMMRKELQMIHEFIADQKSVGSNGTEAFAAMILRSVYGQQYNTLINPFFQKPVKRRLAMLQKKLKQPKAAYLGRILSLPLCALVILAFAKTEQPQQAITILDKEITVVIDAGHGGEDKGAESNGVLEKDLTLALAKTIQQENNNPKIRLVFTRLSDAHPSLKSRTELAAASKADLFISLHVNTLKDVLGVPQEAVGNGFEVVVSGKNENSRTRSTALGSALIQQLSTAYTTRQALISRKSGVWVLDANPVPAVLIECGYLSNAGDKAFIEQGANQKLVAQKILRAIEAFAHNKTMQVRPIVDTLPIRDTANMKEMHVDATNDSVHRITITYKDGRKVTYNEPVKRTVKKNDQTLVVIDGKIAGTMAEIGDLDKKLKPADIASVNVWKGDEGEKRYGKKGKAGVIEITTLAKSKEPHIDASQVPNRSAKTGGAPVQIKPKDDAGAALLVIDGKEMGRMSDYETGKYPFKEDQVESMNILKDKPATDKYGEKGKYGVIEITMKKQ